MLGPGPVFKGGMANYTVSLCRGLAAQPGCKVHLISWTQQYPAIIPRDFKSPDPDTTLAAAGITEHYLLNYNHPASWSDTARLVRSLGAAKLIIQWSIALQGLPLGRLVRLLKGSGVEVIFDLHFVIQKEASLIDGLLSRYALSAADSYIVHSLKTAEELKQLLAAQTFNLSTTAMLASAGSKTVITLYHPVYDLFTPHPDFDAAAWRAAHGLRRHVFLFFGFIRKYKGLHLCIEAFAKLAARRDDVSLLIVGESFWHTLDKTKLSTRIKSALFKVAKALLRPGAEDESNYNPLAMIDQLGIADRTMVVNLFVANADVYQYFQASDALLLFYEYATPSGVESMAYNFKIPILASTVGHFPETIAGRPLWLLSTG